MGSDERDIDKTGSVGITEYPFSKKRNIDATAVNLSSAAISQEVSIISPFYKRVYVHKITKCFLNIA